MGGNRALWPSNVEVIAIENNKNIAKIYMDLYPNDTVMVRDAYEYLLQHYNEFDFIWLSPPCTTHSDIRRAYVLYGRNEPKYPDLSLYEQIFFLQGHCSGKWIIENVVGYYEPLVKPYKIDRHYFWSNFPIPTRKFKTEGRIRNVISTSKRFGFDLSKYKGIDKRAALRNLVNPKVGLYIFDCALKVKQQTF